MSDLSVAANQYEGAGEVANPFLFDTRPTVVDVSIVMPTYILT
jgi:hypothetical protein